MNLSKEVLQTPMWYFMCAYDLWQYTLSEGFKTETPDTQEDILSRLDQLERVRPQDIDMKVRFE